MRIIVQQNHRPTNATAMLSFKSCRLSCPMYNVCHYISVALFIVQIKFLKLSIYLNRRICKVVSKCTTPPVYCGGNAHISHTTPQTRLYRLWMPSKKIHNAPQLILATAVQACFFKKSWAFGSVSIRIPLLHPQQRSHPRLHNQFRNG